MRLSEQVTHLWQCQDTRKQKNNNICCVYGAHAHKRTLYSNKLLFLNFILCPLSAKWFCLCVFTACVHTNHIYNVIIRWICIFFFVIIISQRCFTRFAIALGAHTQTKGADFHARSCRSYSNVRCEKCWCEFYVCANEH